jgi:type III secretion protein J
VAHTITLAGLSVPSLVGTFADGCCEQGFNGSVRPRHVLCCKSLNLNANASMTKDASLHFHGPSFVHRSRSPAYCGNPLAHFLRACLLILACLCLVACDKTLYGALTEQEANEVVALLQQEGVAADKRQEGDTGFSVKVGEGDFSLSMEILTSYGVPGRAVDGLGSVFKKESLVSTPTEERARLTYAMAQELQRSIAQIDGVLVARVHPVLPQKDTLTGRKQKATASVLIKHRPDIDMVPLISQIRGLVSNGIEELDYDDVTVLTVVATPRTRPQAMVKTTTWYGKGLGWTIAALAGLAVLATFWVSTRASRSILKDPAKSTGMGAADSPVNG